MRIVQPHVRITVILILAAALLTGCHQTAATTTQQTTTCGSCGDRNAANVRGTFHMVGGPYPGIDRPLSGTITVHKNDRNGRVVRTVRTGKDGTFATFLPAGRYWFVGTSPHVSGVGCPNVHTVTVTTSSTAHVQVVCAVP